MNVFDKRARAQRANERGLKLDDQGQPAKAIREYERAARIDPSWSAPAYNLGLVYKYSSDWERSLQHNLRATQLNAEDQAGWWNLGIAATALRRWEVARAAWRGAGIAIADGDGPIELPCGTATVRLNPDSKAEVVWADRLDPARARLTNIPLPASDFRYGDVVLHDGAPHGYRKLGDREIPVFNCLALMDPSSFSTWVLEVEVEVERDAAIERLSKLATASDVVAEDWTTSTRLLCKACSEGTPHAEHDHERKPSDRSHQVAIAAPDEHQVRRLIDRWIAEAAGVTVTDLRLALQAAS